MFGYDDFKTKNHKERDGKGEIQSWTRKLNIVRTDRDKKDLFDLMLKGRSRSSCFVFLL